MNYLSEHKLLDYKVLSEKTAAATARYNELSAQIKAAENRMTEIAVLRTHIINYAKTREVYVAYRKAGYGLSCRWKLCGFTPMVLRLEKVLTTPQLHHFERALL